MARTAVHDLSDLLQIGPMSTGNFRLLILYKALFPLPQDER
ncbi:hypothetical protein HDG40_000688 [Paraburkholderia sp. JPY158]|uniref:Uncharacterized protein n=1 Tax=Paraburkholderia atlantica TaxID=2654982 RepID=A0A7W8V4B5_PARAM|nr:hypothetical protein [Paraburkholderia atlantica]